jgi:pimeloyl-ACP methyl ester carboxylesterase
MPVRVPLYDYNARRRTVSVTLIADLVARAATHGINISRVASSRRFHCAIPTRSGAHIGLAYLWKITTMIETNGRLDRGDGIELAWVRLDGIGPTVVFLPGFRSDMTGDKATALASYCGARGQAMLRFDYRGHGASSGDFLDGTIGAWADDALAVIDQLCNGPIVLVGSSMGGWIALLTALARPDRVVALIGIAAAPDFTQRLMWDSMTPPERAMLERDGVLYVPSQYGEPTPITLGLIQDGANHLVLTGRLPIHCPVRLLHGQADPNVPWELALRIAEQLDTTDVRVILVKDGDHRLSRPTDLALLDQTLAALLGQDGA